MVRPVCKLYCVAQTSGALDLGVCLDSFSSRSLVPHEITTGGRCGVAFFSTPVSPLVHFHKRIHGDTVIMSIVRRLFKGLEWLIESVFQGH